MYQRLKCSYSYFSKALEIYLRVLFRCDYPYQLKDNHSEKAPSNKSQKTYIHRFLKLIFISNQALTPLLCKVTGKLIENLMCSVTRKNIFLTLWQFLAKINLQRLCCNVLQ